MPSDQRDSEHEETVMSMMTSPSADVSTKMVNVLVTRRFYFLAEIVDTFSAYAAFPLFLSTFIAVPVLAISLLATLYALIFTPWCGSPSAHLAAGIPAVAASILCLTLAAGTNWRFSLSIPVAHAFVSLVLLTLVPSSAQCPSFTRALLGLESACILALFVIFAISLLYRLYFVPADPAHPAFRRSGRAGTNGEIDTSGMGGGSGIGSGSGTAYTVAGGAVSSAADELSEMSDYGGI